MSVNNNGTIACVTRNTDIKSVQAMSLYDSMTPEMRKLLQDCPYNLISRYLLNPAIMAESIKRIKNDSILATYGEEHPEYVAPRVMETA
jgi:hypothetical protein